MRPRDSRPAAAVADNLDSEVSKMIRMSSSATADHCPFLNRCDGRCGQFLSVNRLGHAFARCFGQYRACPVYAELLWERRHRSTAGQLKQLTAHAGTLVAQAVEPRAKAA